MNEIWTSIISGGFAGAGVVLLLSKLLIENRLKQTVQKFQHELDIKKDVLQADLSLYAHKQNLKYSKYEESHRLALENIYKAVVSTAFSRAGFQKYKSLKNLTNNEEFCSKYFNAFSHSFKVFSESFKKVTSAFDVFLDNSISIDSSTEETVNFTLQEINKYYHSNYNRLLAYHATAQKLFREQKLDCNSAPVDFEVFYDESLHQWLSVTNNSTTLLKNAVRNLLKPEIRT